MQNQITLPLPSEVPAPKFQLFQRVQVGGTKAVITGMKYIDFITALLNSNSKTGWYYTLNVVYGASQATILRFHRTNDVLSEEWEDDIKPIENDATLEVV